MKITHSLFFRLRFQKLFTFLDCLRSGQLIRNIAVDNLESRVTINPDGDVFVLDDSAVPISNKLLPNLILNVTLTFPRSFHAIFQSGLCHVNGELRCCSTDTRWDEISNIHFRTKNRHERIS